MTDARGTLRAALWRHGRADHWSFLFGEIAVYSFVMALASGVFLAVFFKPSMTGVVYHGSYHMLDGVAMRFPAGTWASSTARCGSRRAGRSGWPVTRSPSRCWCPGLIVPGIFFTLVAVYPLPEAKITGDRAVHHFLDRPRDAATRTAMGAAGITFYRLLWAAAANDQIAYHIGLDLYAVTWFFRVAVLAGPLLACTLTQRICLGLTARERGEAEHGRDTGRIVMSPDGGFSEITEPVRRALEDGSRPVPTGRAGPGGHGGRLE